MSYKPTLSNSIDYNLINLTPGLLNAIAVLALISIAQYFYQRSKKLNYPIIKPTSQDIRSVLEENVKKYPETPFILAFTPPMAILPQSFTKEIKSIRNEQASLWDVIRLFFHYKVTNFASDDHMLIDIVKNDISRQITTTLSTIQDEIPYTFEKVLGSCEEWKPHTLRPAIVKIVAMLLKAKQAVFGWPLWLIYIVGPYLKEFKKIEKIKAEGALLVKPLLDEYSSKVDNEEQKVGEESRGENGLQWFFNRLSPDKRNNPKTIVERLIDRNLVTQIMFDLCTYREYIPLLVEEINDVIAEDKYDVRPNSILKLQKSSMSKFGKLDSFMKESMRMSPNFMISQIRLTTSDLTFSSGHTFPKGTQMGVPTWAINYQSPNLHSPGLTKPLNEFDGLRFYKLRQLPGNEKNHLFTSTSPDSITFGYGLHSCPGRVFASNEIKNIIIELLRNWDFRFPDDVNMEGGSWRRPKNLFLNFDCFPNPDAKVEFRKKLTV